MIRVALALLALSQNRDPEKIQYVRPSGQGYVPECTFSIGKSDQGRTIASVTGRGKSTLTVTARYDAMEALLEAEVVQVAGEDRKTATVGVSGGKATVKRAGKPDQEFDAPKGVIVTSAPDWTDAFLLCRLRDGSRAGKQEFPGLWIHPEQASQRLTFSVEKLGSVALEHKGEKLELDRLSIRLRGNSAYVAWADAKGRMIKLVSMPYKPGGSELVLEGFEETAASLKPE